MILVAYWDGAKPCGNSYGQVAKEEDIEPMLDKAISLLKNRWKIWETKIVSQAELMADDGRKYIEELKKQVYDQAMILIEAEQMDPPLPEDTDVDIPG